MRGHILTAQLVNSLGHWSGFYYNADRYPTAEMISLDIHAAPADPKQFQASGYASNGTSWDLAGGYTVDGESGKVTYAFTITYKVRFVMESLRGNLLPNGTTLSGSLAYGNNPQSLPFDFVLKRLSVEAMKFWPSPAELDANKPRALWKFACNAVRDGVARGSHSWEWLQQRWNNGKDYVRLRYKKDTTPLTAKEEKTLSECYRRNTPEEARMYQIFLDLRRRSVPVHL